VARCHRSVLAYWKFESISLQRRVGCELGFCKGGSAGFFSRRGRTAQGKHMERPPSLTPAQQKEATRRRTQGATLQELADSYDRSISTMRRVTRAA